MYPLSLFCFVYVIIHSLWFRTTLIIRDYTRTSCVQTLTALHVFSTLAAIQPDVGICCLRFVGLWCQNESQALKQNIIWNHKSSNIWRPNTKSKVEDISHWRSVISFHLSSPCILLCNLVKSIDHSWYCFRARLFISKRLLSNTLSLRVNHSKRKISTYPKCPRPT